MKSSLNVAFIGNPNCGKTTLFNAYTGAKLKVANWPGVTVEKKEGNFNYEGKNFKLVDLPGTYSLTSYTMEEKLSRGYILSDEADVIVDVTDASCLERNLYLALQLIELGKPVVIALNMMDIVKERGMEIDLHRLPEMLGVPVIPVSARKKTGLNILMHAVDHHKENQKHTLEHHHTAGEHRHSHHEEYAVVYSDEIEDKIDIVSDVLKAKYKDIKNLRWHAIKILEQDEEIMQKYPVDWTGIVDKSYESQIINEKYNFIEEIISEVLVNKEQKSEKTDKIDKFFTHKYLGIPIFLAIMAAVFFLTFTVGDFIKGYFETAIGAFSEIVQSAFVAMGVKPWLTSLAVEGIIGGVGGILTFLPNIFILFLALAFLEDSGYMARVAYIMDGVMSKVGLSGRAFIPMLLGFGCTVPAVMATRALENKKDRLKTILITPFMSCSARLPVYVLFSEMFFGKYAMLAAYSMYLIGVLVAVLIALIMNGINKNGEINTLLIELPEYKAPNARTIIIYVWEKVSEYIKKAGTTIFLASVLLWFLLNFSTGGMTENMSESFAASIGKILAPLFIPCGLGFWQIVVALISGIAAKEVVVSSMSVLFGISNIAGNVGMGELTAVLAKMGFGAANAYAMMVFCLLYIPCAASIATIKKETESLGWTLFAVGMQLATAWVVSAVIYNILNVLL